MKFPACLSVAAFLLGWPPIAALAAQPIQLQDYRSLINIESPEFSPGGSRLAFVTVRSDFVHDRYAATLRVMRTAGGPSQILVQGMRDLSSPRWSPDGKTIAFIAQVGKQAPQIWTVPAAGGTPEELGDAPNGVEQFAWSPDGQTIAYVTPDNSPIAAKDRRKHHDLFVIHDDDYLVSGPAVPSHIGLLTFKDGKTRQLTFGTTSVLEAGPPFGGGVSTPAWSSDGQWLVYAQQADADDADSDRTRIVAVNVASGAEKPITGKTSYEYNPRFAPEGDAIAYLYIHGPDAVSDMDLFIGSVNGGTPRDVSVQLDRNLLPALAWLPDGQGLVVMADNHISQDLYVQPLQGQGHVLDLGALNALGFAVSSKGAVAVVADNTHTAPELYLLESVASRPVRLTDFNRRFSDYAYGRSIEVQWRAPDGQRNDGILTYPDDYQPGHKYPLVVSDHGGPEWAALEHFDGGDIGPLREVYAAHGYLVFEPNYRGSDNLGNAHEHAIYRDPGVGPDSDVIAGIQMLEQQGLVDASRICATGHSYGGYMTGWLITHQHFWRCAVVADGAVDWTEEYELAGDGNLAWVRDSLGGSPWDKTSAALYIQGSPITYAGDITTPTLIVSGTDDAVVPITESFALYHALASRHVPVKFIGIPRAHHLPQFPVERELYYAALEHWVVKYLGS
ncbi:MAG: prolyl oligopeptidase family serine peptidase [Gammaproteobacteria bacterium]